MAYVIAFMRCMPTNHQSTKHGSMKTLGALPLQNPIIQRMMLRFTEHPLNTGLRS